MIETLNKIKIAVVGSRTFQDYNRLELALDKLILMFPGKEIVIVSGGATGADSLAEQYAAARAYKTEIFEADWATYGKSAGFKRNSQIVDEADFLVAFWNGSSRGTNNVVNKATMAMKPVLVIPFGDDSATSETQA